MVDCRRILKWTYAYGYYRFAASAQAQTSVQTSASAEALKQQQEFFEFNQVKRHTRVGVTLVVSTSATVEKHLSDP